LYSLFCAEEDILRGEKILPSLAVTIIERDIDESCRFVECTSPNIARPNRHVVREHLQRLKVSADVVFVIHAALDHTRASATFSIDDYSAVKEFTYSGVKKVFGKFTRVPGMATIGYYDYDTSNTPLHEFGHAASEEDNGRVTDLYHDIKVNSFDVNKRKRNQGGIPALFCKYNGANFKSDLNRDSLGYGTWKTFHPEPVDGSVPNLMDDYWLSKTSPFCCRFDVVTQQWLKDRLEFKCDRKENEPNPPEGLESLS